MVSVPFHTGHLGATTLPPLTCQVQTEINLHCRNLKLCKPRRKGKRRLSRFLVLKKRISVILRLFGRYRKSPQMRRNSNRFSLSRKKRKSPPRVALFGDYLLQLLNSWFEDDEKRKPRQKCFPSWRGQGLPPKGRGGGACLLKDGGGACPLKDGGGACPL